VPSGRGKGREGKTSGGNEQLVPSPMALRGVVEVITVLELSKGFRDKILQLC
jgi:hypothetical protein